MMKKKISFVLLVLLGAWLPLFMGAWDKDKPAGSDILRDGDDDIRTNQAALETAIGQDHEFSTGGNNTGKHLQITFDDPLAQAPATVAASEGVLYTLDVSNKAELHFEDEDENTLQMTSGGDLYSSTGLTVAGNTTLSGTTTLTGAVTANGGITLGAGDDLIGSATSDITFNTDKFTVAGATGNTVVAGTLGVTGVATLGDTSALATSAAPTADAQIANKKYVDDLIAALEDRSLSAYTTLDSQDNAMLKAHAYLAGSDGWVSAYDTDLDTGELITIYVDTDSNPASGGVVVQQTESRGSDASGSVSALVAEGEYFEVTSTGGSSSIKWKSYGTLSKPVDQD